MSVALGVLTLVHCVGWSLAGKAQSAASSKPVRLNAQTRSLKEERVNIGQIITNPKQVKQGTVLRGPAGLAVFSCGIRVTLLEGSDRRLLLAKGSKKPSWFC